MICNYLNLRDSAFIQEIQHLIAGSSSFEILQEMLKLNPGQQRVQRQQPEQAVTLYGYRRQNHYDYVSTSSQVIIRYNIYPVGLAKIQYLRTKVQMILGEDIISEDAKTINPFFQYAIKRIIYFEEISSIKKTNYIQILVNQFAENMSKHQEKKIQMLVEDDLRQIENNKKNQKFIQGILNQLANKKNQKLVEYVLNQTANQTRKKLLQNVLNQIADKKVDLKITDVQDKIQECVEDVLNQSAIRKIIQQKQGEYKQKHDRLVKMMKYETKMVKLKKKIKSNILLQNTKQQAQQKQLLQYQIDENFKNIDSLQNLKVSQAFLKYSIFQKRYKGYYDIQLKLQRRDAKPYFVIRINRLSKQIQPVLQNMITLVQQRNKDLNYRPQTKILISDIFTQIKKFQNINGNQNKNHYIYLAPETVFFDQIALIPKLSYEPLLLNTFGVQNRPMSAENRICFHPSPRSFNYFKSLPQYDKFISCMLNDPLYGNKQIYENDMHRLSTFEKQQIFKQQQILCLKQQQIVVWRMILLSNYLSYSKEYGLCPQVSFLKKQQHHKSKLQILQKEVKNNSQQLCKYLGIEQNSNSVGKFQFSMSRLSDFLQPMKQNDSIIQKYKDANSKKYFQWRNNIIKEIVRLLVNDCLFGKVYNVKKYVIIYLILAIEIFQEYNYLACLNDKQSNQATNIQGLIKNRKYFRGFLEVQIRRLKGDKSHIPYQLSTYNKIIEYGQKRNDAQAKYIKQDQIGRILFEYIKQLHTQLRLFHRLNDSLNQIQLKESLIEEDLKAYKEIINDTKTVAFRSLATAKSVLGQFLYNQLKLKHRQGPHKIPIDANDQVRQFFSQNTQRLDLISLIYFNFDQSKLILYDTLVLPQFNLQQNDRKVQIPRNFDFLAQQESKMSLVAEVIEMAKLQPKKMTYLVSKGQTLFQEIEKGKRKPLHYVEKFKN